jgi:hypothetical protein
MKRLDMYITLRYPYPNEFVRTVTQLANKSSE